MNRLNGIVFYAGFNEPKLVAESFRELLKEATNESNYRGKVTDVFVQTLTADLEVIDMSLDTPLTELTTIECHLLNNWASSYGIFIRPSLSDLQEFNDSVGLPRNTHLESFIGGVA